MTWGFPSVVARITNSCLRVLGWESLGGVDAPRFCLSIRQLLGIWGADVSLARENEAAVNVFVALCGVLRLRRVVEPRGELVKTRVAGPHLHTL